MSWLIRGGDVTLPVSLHGAAPWKAGPACCTNGHRTRRHRGSGRSRTGSAASGRGQVAWGRMTSHALPEAMPTGMADVTKRVRGLIFFGFPLHRPVSPARNAQNTWNVLTCRCCSYRARAIPWQISPSCVHCVRSWHLARGYISWTLLTTPPMFSKALEQQTRTYSASLREPLFRGRIPLPDRNT